MATVGVSTVPMQTYLQQCSEDLQPGNLTSWQRKSTLYQVASVATLVAYTILAVGGLALSIFYAPIFVPVVAITSAFLLKFVQNGASILEGLSGQARARADQIKQISEHFQTLSSSSTQQIQQTLQEKGVQWSTIPGMTQDPSNLKTLNPLLARHLFWEKQIEKLEGQKKSKLSEASRLVAESEEKNQAEIYNLRSAALIIEKNLLESKIKNAFVNAVLRQPTFKGSLENVGTFSPLSGQERAVGNAASSGSATKFFTFKNNTTPTLTFDEVKSLGISELALRLMPAMTA